MKCKIISISHKPADWEKKASDFYLKQIPNHLKLSFVEVKPTASKSMSRGDAIQNESSEISKHTPPRPAAAGPPPPRGARTPGAPPGGSEK